MPLVKGTADGQEVNAVVNELFSGQPNSSMKVKERLNPLFLYANYTHVLSGNYY